MSMQLTTGQTYLTPSLKDAYKIRTGAVDIFVVPEENGIFRKPQFILSAGPGVTIPGMQYTDADHVTWRLQLEAAEETTLQVIEHGATKPLKRKFMARAQISSGDDMAFEEALMEQYHSGRIAEDIFIFRSEQSRQKERDWSLNLIRQAAEPPRKEMADKIEETISDQSDAGDRRKGRWGCYRTILAVSTWQERCSLCLLGVALAGTGIGMMTAARHLVPFSGGMLLCFCAALVLYFMLRGMLLRVIAHTTGRMAKKQQGEEIDRFFDRDAGHGLETDAEREPLDDAFRIWTAYDSIAQTSRNAYEGTLSLWIALACWVFLLTQLWLAAAITGAIWIVGSAVLYGGRIDPRQEQMDADALRRNAEAELEQFLGNSGKVRLSGAKDHILRRYYADIAQAKTIQRSVQRRTLGGDVLLRGMLFLAALLLFSGLCLVLPWDPGTVLLTVAGGILICAEGFSGFRKWASIGRDPEAMAACGLLTENQVTNSEAMAACHPLTGNQAADPDDVDAPEEETTDHDDSALLTLCGGTFSYAGRQVLTDVYLRIQEGEYVGIAGASGSGKTTLMKLLAGMLSPAQGTLRFRGTAITEKNRDRIRSHAGIVLQDDQLLRGSIRENIIAGHVDAEWEGFRTAAELVLLHEDVAEMPMGYETLISEHAETVSAGQKQRILLARALAADPQILFLDEAESDLDDETRNRLHENIRMRVPTGVVVSHHFRTLSKCDRIFVMEQGRIAEEGTAAELIRRKGHFFKLMERQL